MSDKTRRHFDAEEKVKILKHHLLDKESVADICDELNISPNQFYRRQQRYGKLNEHNGPIPHDWWLEEWEIEIIVNFYVRNPFEGHRQLTYMMMDRDIVAVSASTVYRILSKKGLLGKLRRKTSSKGSGSVQPLRPYKHWHIDITYLNLGGAFYYLWSILNGYRHVIVHWEIRESMKERDGKIIFFRGF
jgi:transposase InsO family protein